MHAFCEEIPRIYHRSASSLIPPKWVPFDPQKNKLKSSWNLNQGHLWVGIPLLFSTPNKIHSTGIFAYMYHKSKPFIGKYNSQKPKQEP